MTTFYALIFERIASYTGYKSYDLLIDPQKPPESPFTEWTDIDDWRRTVGIGVYQLPDDWELIKNWYGKYIAKHKNSEMWTDIITLQKSKRIPRYLHLIVPADTENIKATLIKKL